MSIKMKAKAKNAGQAERKRVPKSERPCLERNMEAKLICEPREGDCEKCGWNPEIERERMERIREQF